MTRSKSLLAAAGVGVSALLVAAPAKAFIVFAPAAFAGVIIGAVVVLVTIFIARWSSVLIERRLANRRHIDPGLRYTICRLAKYIIITVGLLVALKQAFALDLTSIAVVFTALSVGIGFGLQYIAADIASGFILLFERPIRIGDRVTIGDDEGDVQSINLRTTIVTTKRGCAGSIRQSTTSAGDVTPIA